MSLSVIEREKLIHDHLKSLKYEWLQLRMKVSLDQAFYKKLLHIQEKLVLAQMKQQQEQILEFSIQISESLNALKHISSQLSSQNDDLQIVSKTNQIFDRPQTGNSSRDSIKNLKQSISILESKVGMFLTQFLDVREIQLEESQEKQLENLLYLLHQKISKMKDYDITEIPPYLQDCKEECSQDKQHYQTLSEVEDFVYQALHRHKQYKNVKDASLEDLMAVTMTEHSQDLTNRLRLLILQDKQYQRQVDSFELPSIVQESDNLDDFFANNKEQMENSNLKKVKKIEFSQSIKYQDENEKSLPFTHAKIDSLVFKGSMKNKEFDIHQAKQLLKQVVQGRKQSTVETELSFEMPVVESNRDKDLMSIPSELDAKYLHQKKKISEQGELLEIGLSYKDRRQQEHENMLSDTVKKLDLSKENFQSLNKQLEMVNPKIELKKNQVKDNNLVLKHIDKKLLEKQDRKPLDKPEKRQAVEVYQLLQENESQNKLRFKSRENQKSEGRLKHNPSQVSLAMKLQPKEEKQSPKSKEPVQKLSFQIFKLDHEESKEFQKQGPIQLHNKVNSVVKEDNSFYFQQFINSKNRNKGKKAVNQSVSHIEQDQPLTLKDLSTKSKKRVSQNNISLNNGQQTNKQSNSQIQRKNSLPRINYQQNVSYSNMISNQKPSKKSSLSYFSQNSYAYPPQQDSYQQSAQIVEKMVRSKSSANFSSQKPSIKQKKNQKLSQQKEKGYGQFFRRDGSNKKFQGYRDFKQNQSLTKYSSAKKLTYY